MTNDTARQFQSIKMRPIDQPAEAIITVWQLQHNSLIDLPSL